MTFSARSVLRDVPAHDRQPPHTVEVVTLSVPTGTFSPATWAVLCLMQWDYEAGV